MVVKDDPVADHADGMLWRFEPVPVRALLHQRADDPFDHPLLLEAMGRDEFLLQPLVAYQRRVAEAIEDRPIVKSKKERRRQPPSVLNRVIKACSSAISAV